MVTLSCAFVCFLVDYPSKAISYNKGCKSTFYKSILFFPCNSMSVNSFLVYNLLPYLSCIPNLYANQYGKEIKDFSKTLPMTSPPTHLWHHLLLLTPIHSATTLTPIPPTLTPTSTNKVNVCKKD